MQGVARVDDSWGRLVGVGPRCGEGGEVVLRWIPKRENIIHRSTSRFRSCRFEDGSRGWRRKEVEGGWDGEWREEGMSGPGQFRSTSWLEVEVEPEAEMERDGWVGGLDRINELVSWDGGV